MNGLRSDLERVLVWWAWQVRCKALRGTSLWEFPNLLRPSTRECWELCHARTASGTLLCWSWDPSCRFPSAPRSAPFSIGQRAAVIKRVVCGCVRHLIWLPGRVRPWYPPPCQWALGKLWGRHYHFPRTWISSWAPGWRRDSCSWNSASSRRISSLCAGPRLGRPCWSRPVSPPRRPPR